MDRLQIGTLQLDSRVFLGTALYPDRQTMFNCIHASEVSMVTISLRRVSLQSSHGNLYSQLQDLNLHLLPNPAGCLSAKEAILTAELAREALETNRIKNKSSQTQIVSNVEHV